MKTVSVAEAKAKLPSLLQTVEAGETLVITRHGKAIAEVHPVTERSGQSWSEGIDWLESRLQGRTPAVQSAASLIREMRDEGDH